MKKLAIATALLLTSWVSLAQSYRNEWINFSPANPFSLQQYFKMKIAKEGIYRIDTASLLQALVPYSSVNPNKFQIYYQGVEQYIYVQNNGDPSKLDGNDYIEFYTTKNDGVLDAGMYKKDSSPYAVDSTVQPNPNYSLFTDTAIYFLTFNTTANGKRVTLETDTAFSNYTDSPYFINHVFHEYPDEYAHGRPSSVGSYDPDYTEGEGWASYRFDLGGSKSDGYLYTRNIYSSGPAATVSTTLIGVSNDNNVSPDHRIHIEVKENNNTTTFDTTVTYEGYTMKRYNFAIPLSK